MLMKKLRKYIGLDLPKRDLSLNFDLPTISAELQVGRGSDGELFRRLNEVKDSPAEYFDILFNVIKHINRCALSPRQRLSLTRQVLRLFYSKALESLVQFGRKKREGGDIPDPEDRKQALRHIAEIAKTLVMSYQITFSRIYKSSNFKYARAHQLRQECVSFIFELTLLRQQALALRYQLLDASDWRGINTLFYVMHLYETEDAQKPWPTLKRELGVDKGRSSVSWQTLFAQIHITAKFDMLRWPTHLQWIIGTYVDSVENSVSIALFDSGRLGRNQMIAYCYATQPASQEILATARDPALLLDFSGLNEAIRKDCRSLLQAKKKRDLSALPVRFARFPETEHFVVFNQLMHGMLETESSLNLDDGTVVKDLRIYVGFMEVFSLLRYQKSDFATEERLTDVLAQRSAQIAEDHTVAKTTVWILLMQDDNMVRFSTEENSYTTHISLGSVLAYGVGKDINRPKVAVVARIYRPTHKRVVIDLHILADYAESVLMTVNTAQQAASAAPRTGKPALLLHNSASGERWDLMLQPQDMYVGVDQIAIHREKKEYAVELETWRNATNDFHLYNTTLTSEYLGVSKDPEYAATKETPATKTLMF